MSIVTCNPWRAQQFNSALGMETKILLETPTSVPAVKVTSFRHLAAVPTHPTVTVAFPCPPNLRRKGSGFGILCFFLCFAAPEEHANHIW